MQIFVSDKGYVKVYPMSKVSKYPQALNQFAKDVGSPEVLIADPHPLRLVPAQDGLFALILWYVAKTLFRS